MIKYSIISIFIFFVANNSIIGQEINNDENQILWSEKVKLKWSDFQGKPKPEESRGLTVAETQGAINILNIVLINNLPQITIGAFFIKNKSWTITKDTLALQHEQLHFDIYELYVRKIRKKFKELNEQNETNIQSYQDYYTKLVIESIKMQELYDSEVYFNDDMLRKWIAKIHKNLKLLDNYK